jgi:hypothetical protein
MRLNFGVVKAGAVNDGVMKDGTAAMLIQAQSTDAVALPEATLGTVDFMAASPAAAGSALEAVRAVEVDSTVADIGNQLCD